MKKLFAGILIFAIISIWVTGVLIKVENGKSQIDDSICIKCGSCEGICPVEAIKINK